MPEVFKNPGGYSGPLVGFEIRAFTPFLITGSEDDEDAATSRSVRRAARHPRDVSGLPFRTVLNSDRGASTPTERAVDCVDLAQAARKLEASELLTAGQGRCPRTRHDDVR
jgi:hypothetical protein